MKPKGMPVRWSGDVAYAVGLITTDGCLSTDGRHIIMRSSDIAQLKTFKKCLNLSNKISETKNNGWAVKPAYRVQFGNVIFYKWLANLGLMPNKSKRIRELKIPDRYFFDFLRGHLDGDGSIRKYYDPIYPNSLRLYVRFHSGSLKHVRWIQARIKALLDIKGFVENKQREYSISFAKKDSILLLSYLYPQENIPCLKRKYRIAQSFLTISQ